MKKVGFDSSQYPSLTLHILHERCILCEEMIVDYFIVEEVFHRIKTVLFHHLKPFQCMLYQVRIVMVAIRLLRFPQSDFSPAPHMGIRASGVFP